MSCLPDLEAWVVFARVAETGSFTRAAVALGLSKATVSKSVARLEVRLGAALFSRTSRRLALTETGRASVAAAARLLAEAEAIEEEARAHAAEPRGTVRMTAPMSFGIVHLAPLLPALFAAHPGIAIDLDLADEIRDLIEGRFDLALRIAALPDSSLRARRLCQVRRLLVGAPSYFALHGRPSHPSDLARHACLGYAYLPSPDRWRFADATGAEVEIVPRGPLRANNADALGPALLAGLGLAIQPEFLVWRDLAAGRLEAAMEEWSLPPIALNIVTPPGRLRPARATAVIDFLVDRLAAAPWAMQEAPAERAAAVGQ
jgi:DNA-binding transcriptional LysR family regulator